MAAKRGDAERPQAGKAEPSGALRARAGPTQKACGVPVEFGATAFAEMTDTISGVPFFIEKTGAPEDPKSTSHDMISVFAGRPRTWHTSCSDGLVERSRA